MTPAERTASVRRVTARLCVALGWAPLHEVGLANGRRADILALCPGGRFVCIEIKSDARDFLADRKWPEYRAFCDQLFFAVDTEFPVDLVPADTGLIVAADTAELVREAPHHPLLPARRRALLHRFATLAALRLTSVLDPYVQENLKAD